MMPVIPIAAVVSLLVVAPVESVSPAAAVPQVSLFVSACIDGTLHGEPKTLCREFQIRRYSTVEACEKAHANDAMDFLLGLRWLPARPPARGPGSRCAPAVPDPEDVEP